MFSLLPKEQKSKLLKQYRFRLVFIIIAATIIVVGIGFFSLLPSYFVVHSEEANILTLKNNVKKSISSKSDEDLEKTLINIKQNISALGEKESDTVSILGEIVKAKPEGVHINNINFINDKISTSTITILGVSSDRPNLILFSKRLQENPRWSSVDLPISNLAKDFDINFNINIAEKL